MGRFFQNGIMGKIKLATPFDHLPIDLVCFRCVQYKYFSYSVGISTFDRSSVGIIPFSFQKNGYVPGTIYSPSMVVQSAMLTDKIVGD